jgi:hypothetical protein
MATITNVKMIDVRALDVFMVLTSDTNEYNYGNWSAKKLIELYAAEINKDFQNKKTPEQIAKHIVKLYMKD